MILDPQHNRIPQLDSSTSIYPAKTGEGSHVTAGLPFPSFFFSTPVSVIGDSLRQPPSCADGCSLVLDSSPGPGWQGPPMPAASEVSAIVKRISNRVSSAAISASRHRRVATRHNRSQPAPMRTTKQPRRLGLSGELGQGRSLVDAVSCCWGRWRIRCSSTREPRDMNQRYASPDSTPMSRSCAQNEGPLVRVESTGVSGSTLRVG